MRYKLLLMLLCVGTISSIAQHDYRLMLQSGNMQPAENATTFINDAVVNPQDVFNGFYYRLIQFNAIPTQEEKNKIRQSGLVLLNYIPYNTFVTAIPKGFDKTLLRQLNVRSVVRLNEVQKMNINLLGQAPDYARNVHGFVDVIVEYYKNIPHEQVASALIQYTKLGEQADNHVFILRVAENELRNLASKSCVFYMAPINSPSTPDDTKGRSLHRNNTLDSDYSSGLHFDGSGVVIGLGDDGHVGPHIDFKGRMTMHTASDNGTHGDMTCGVSIGGGNLDPTKRGQATGAYLHLYDYSGYPQIVNAVSNYNTLGTVITSTSYSEGTGPNTACNKYTTNTEFGDNLVYNNTQISFVYSAGNQGTGNCGYPVAGGWGTITGGYKAGKNVIACGNLTNGDVLDATSSRGPLDDGRMKPDICSNGNGQISTVPGNAYQTAAVAVNNGTSAACPSIAGTTALLYQAYKSLNGGLNPESGLIKACMLNGAEDLGNPGPDFTYGWGRVNSLRAYKTFQEVRYIKDSVSQGQIKTHTITVPSGVSDLRVMIYWTDPAGSSLASQSLVNDINMHLTDPINLDWNPWVLDPTPVLANITANAVRGIDYLNNMEQVTVPAALQGTWTVTVDGFSIPQGPQSYYFVYEFRTQELDLTYPQGGEGFVPGEQEVIRWDAIKGLGNFTLEYSTDAGLSWILISNAVSQNALQYPWTVPGTITGKACIRVSRGGFSAVSDTLFSIIGVPTGIMVDYACVDSLQLTWNPVANAIGYAIYKLGSEHMEVIGTSTTNDFVVTGLNPIDEYWFSVGAITADSTNGRRAIAIRKAPGTLNCQIANDAEATSLLSPGSGTLSFCQGSGNIPVSLRITNNGLNTISNFPVTYSLNNGTPIMEMVTDSIQSGASYDYIFITPVNYAVPGNYNLVVWLNTPGDNNIYNDTLKTSSIVINGTVATIPFVENFDSYALCAVTADCEVTVCPIGNGWVNETNLTADDIDFRVSSGVTASANTGPDNDHTLGSAAGRYIYLEASGCFGKTAKLLSPCLDLTAISGPQLSFWYHMYGANMGELHVDVLFNGVWTEDVAAPVIGNQGNLWKKVVVDLSAFAGEVINVRFRGITGADFASDLALDDINLIESNVAPDAAFVANYTSACVGNTVTLLDKSTFIPTTWQWSIAPATFNFVNGTNASSQNPQVQFSSLGTYDVKLVASNSFGIDSTTSTSYINIISPTSITLTEDFEGASFPPVGWRVESAQNNYTWEHVLNITGIAGTLTSAAKINNFDYSPVGGLDGLARIEISLAGAVSPIMTFDRAYVRAFVSPIESLRIDVSTDCGNTYTPTGYLKAGAALATAPNSTTSWTPTQASQWRKDTLNLSAWVGQDISLKFVNISASGNNLYLDNINIAEFSGINEPSLNAAVNIYPNPSDNGIFNIVVNGIKNQSSVFTVTDVQGKLIEQRIENLQNSFKTTVDLHLYNKGIYFLEIRTDAGVNRFKLSVL